MNRVLSLAFASFFLGVDNFFGSYTLFFYGAEAKRLQCATLATEEGLVDESTLLTWGYGTEQR